MELAQKYGVRIGAINLNLFQDQIYKYGSICNRDQSVRATAIEGRVSKERKAWRAELGLTASGSYA